MMNNRTDLVKNSGSLHIYYANKTFKHWKKRWLQLQDQQLSIYQDSFYKRLEKTIHIQNYRVSITNSYDSISHKGYTFKIYNPYSSNEKPIYFAANTKQSMTQWINALRLSASIINDVPVETYFGTDLHSIDSNTELDYNGWMNNNSSKTQYKSYKPTMPVAATSTINEQNRFLNSYDQEEEDIDYNNRWYHGRSTSPVYPQNVSNGVIHQSSSATIGSWGFDVNRSANGQTPLSFTSNNNNNNNDHRTITRTSRRLDELTEDYNERLVDRTTTPPQRFKLRTPTLTRHRDGNDFTVVDRLVLGPNRVAQTDYYPSNESPRQQYMSPTTRSRQSSTRSILRRRSKSIGDFTTPTTSTSPPPPPHLTQSYQQQYQYHERPQLSPNNHHRTYAEHELMAWQNRMLQRDHRGGNNQIVRPPSRNTNGWTQSPRMSSKRGGFNSSQTTNRQMPVSTRPTSVMSNLSGSQRFDHDCHESINKSSRIIKRYVELLNHLLTFYEKITDQLYGRNTFLKNNSSPQQSVFMQHCRKIAEQLQRCKPIWERKMIDLQHLLKDMSTHEWSRLKSETTFLQRRSTLINLIQTLNSRKDLDDTQFSILNDIDRVLHEDKLAVQLQDELSTLLQHQSLLNDFTSLLQWNRQIYSPNEQNRVENILPLLREQINTTDSYVSHVSQQLTELVTNLRSLEKYIISHVNTIPCFDEGLSSPNRNGWRSHNETDIDTLKTRNQTERIKEDFQRSPRYQSRPLSMHTPTNQQYHLNGSPNYRSNNYTNENFEWHRRSPSPTKQRSVSMTRYPDPSEPVRGPSTADDYDRDGLRTPTKWTPRKNSLHLNTNNSNSNSTTATTRMATVKSARRDHGLIPNSILKPYPHTRATLETKKDFDIDTIDKEIYRPDKVDIPDRLIDFGNDDQMLTPNERLAKMKKKEEVRKMLSKQSMQELNDHDYNERDIHLPYNHHRLEKEREKALNLQSVLAEEAKEKSRQVAAKHYLNKSYQQRASHLNT
ncbi:unnamed protein product [Adineta steineri]|uniref:PH domain-containing protein n=2 Tax=Adineta steineri TaxID=433720 RepID=A0A818VH85_9BILA|nr:unnamed protein product [Adineta steineri]